MYTYGRQYHSVAVSLIVGSFSKAQQRRQRRQRQRQERHQTKDLMSKTIIAMHMRVESLYISLPSSAKQQREMTKFYSVLILKNASRNG